MEAKIRCVKISGPQNSGPRPPAVVKCSPAVAKQQGKVQRIIPDEQPCFDLTQISTLISQLCAGLFFHLSLLFA